MDTPYICIASFIEATIFKSIHPTMYLILNQRKNEEVISKIIDKTMVFNRRTLIYFYFIDLIKNQNPKNTLKTMIVCTTAQEAEKLNEYLITHQHIYPLETLLAHENMNSFDLLGTTFLGSKFRHCCYNEFCSSHQE